MSKMSFLVAFHPIMREMCVMTRKVNLILSKIDAKKFHVYGHAKLFSVTKTSSDCQLCAVSAKLYYFGPKC